MFGKTLSLGYGGQDGLGDSWVDVTAEILQMRVLHQGAKWGEQAGVKLGKGLSGRTGHKAK